MRTSKSHPLQIASVQAQPGQGRIGITFCPGKKQPDAFSGAWDRDLALDLDAIAEFGAAVVVSLIEQAEIQSLAVAELGAEVARRHMEWAHLPIPDVSIPGREFERQWLTVGAGLRQRLRDGFAIVVHCKGGLGRAGTIATRLLIELGVEPSEAIARVREVRPGALETAEQVRFVERLGPIAEEMPATSAAAVRDRARGALLGLAVGDAVGTTLEFRTRDSYSPLTDMVGGGPFHLQPGEWTDDTSMALALAESLIDRGALDPADLMGRFEAWRQRGAYSCTGICFDIGMTVSAALDRWRWTGDPLAGSTDPTTAGNGSLMRLAPVALRYWQDRPRLHQAAIDQSLTTHGAPEAVSACVAYAELLAEAIAGKGRNVMAPRRGSFAGAVAKLMQGSWRGKPRAAISSSGYVAHSLEAALWAVGRTGDFRGAMLTAANLGGDADTTAAIAGQLAGALYGASGIPADWLEKLAWRERIEALADRLYSL